MRNTKATSDSAVELRSEKSVTCSAPFTREHGFILLDVGQYYTWGASESEPFTTAYVPSYDEFKEPKQIYTKCERSHTRDTADQRFHMVAELTSVTIKSNSVCDVGGRPSSRLCSGGSGGDSRQ